MRTIASLASVAAALVFVVADVAAAQNPPTPPAGQRGGGGGGGGGAQQGRGGRGRGVQIMTLATTSWTDGARIPAKHTQLDAEVSPPLSWGDPPEGTQSFLLIMRDMDAVSANDMSGTVHWMVWNIPATARSLKEAFPHGPEQPDGTRQISMSGPYYRGPAVAAGVPPHHYVFELFALDTVLNVPSRNVAVAPTRTAIMEQMAGRVRAKGVLVGIFGR